MPNVHTKFTSDVAELEKAYEKLLRQNAKLMEQNQKLASQSRRAGREKKDLLRGTTQQVATLAGSYLSVQGAIGAINSAHQTWLQNIRLVSTEAQKASNQMIAFAALQEGGTKAQRVRAASDLATQFGVSDRGEAFNTVQALQSARGGDYRAGLAAARTVFAASQVGIGVERGRELEVLGASQGQGPGQALRRAFVAGQASARDPEVLAGAAPGLKFFKDKDFGFAAAAVLAGSVRPDQLPTFVKQGGLALSDVGPVREALKARGIQADTQQQRLAAMAKLGIDTPAEIKSFGVNELRQIESLAALVPNFGEVQRTQAAIKKQAQPGIFGRQRAAVEGELPITSLTRQIAIARSMYKDELAFGDEAVPATRETLEQQIRGAAMVRLPRGSRGQLITSPFDENGGVTRFSEMMAIAQGLDTARYAQELTRVREELEKAGNTNKEILDTLREGNQDRRRQANRTPAPVLDPNER